MTLMFIIVRLPISGCADRLRCRLMLFADELSADALSPPALYSAFAAGDRLRRQPMLSRPRRRWLPSVASMPLMPS